MKPTRLFSIVNLPRCGTVGFLLLLLSFIAAMPGLAHEDYKVLVFSKTAGFRHVSITNGWAMIQQLGATNYFGVDITEDATAFTYTNLTQYKAVIWLNTTGDVLNSTQQSAFEQYIRNAGGFVGIHAATDTEYGWSWYGQLVGARFASHPAGTPTATVKVADSAHPSTATLPRRWTRVDEWYNFQTNPRGTVHVLATVDENTYAPGAGAMGYDHPIAWCRNFDGGRAWYTALGHTPESYSEPEFRQHVLGGIEWAAGVKEGDAKATVNTSFQKVILDSSPSNPMELAIAKDGRVFIAERGGRVRIWKPQTSSVVTAGQLSVFDQLEDGLLGMALDPGFETNQWIYLFYSPSGAIPEQHVSRFTMSEDTLTLASEVILLQIPNQRAECCHSAGSLAFGPDGTLYIATGDNTNPFDSDGYTTIDERPGRSAWDSQKSASNANDLRGKILRILPQPNGTYTIPPGNLFPPGTAGTRPEVYVMGNKNPFRIAVDQQTGWLYWGEVGPDAVSADPARGPEAYDEWNQARTAGNYGWPYFVGTNLPYRDYDFATGVSGPYFDPAAPVNNSPNNTGITNLPPARPAWIPVARAGTTPGFPELLTGVGRCVFGGPVYHYDEGLTSPRRLPAYYDNTAFIYDWSNDYIWEAKLDENGDLLKINRFLSTLSFNRPHEMEIGPDGALYMIEWGNDFWGDNPEARVIRIDYVGGNRAPVALATATPNAGGTPLAVQFSSAATYDPEGDALTYTWSFFGNVATNSTAANPLFTYTNAGNYNARLTVRDSSGNAAVADVAVTAGNHRPVPTIAWPPNGGIFEWGRGFAFGGNVFDAEDGSTTNGTISCSVPTWVLAIGHEDHSHDLAQTNACVGQFVAPAGHGNNGDNLTLLVRASYTDQGAPPAAALNGQTVHLLQPARKEAEHHSTQSGITNTTTSDADGNLEVSGIDHGDFISFSPVNLTNITALKFRVAANIAGGQIEVRHDSPAGNLLATASIPDSAGAYTNVIVPIADPGGSHGLFLVFRRNPGDTNLFRLNWLAFMGGGIAGPVVVAPHASSISEPSDGSLTIVWNVSPGRTYRFEYKDNLSDTNWTTLGTDYPATLESVAIVDATATNQQRFYRAVDVTGP